MFKRTAILASIALVAALASVSSAEAKVRLKPINCPVAKAAESFRITGAKGELEGVRSEYQWLAANRPGWKRTDQALITKGNKAYDLLTIVKGRKQQVICFDITAFFGKRDFGPNAATGAPWPPGSPRSSPTSAMSGSPC